MFKFFYVNKLKNSNAVASRVHRAHSHNLLLSLYTIIHEKLMIFIYWFFTFSLTPLRGIKYHNRTRPCVSSSILFYFPFVRSFAFFLLNILGALLSSTYNYTAIRRVCMHPYSDVTLYSLLSTCYFTSAYVHEFNAKRVAKIKHKRKWTQKKHVNHFEFHVIKTPRKWI